jgi:hypothetical protein
MEIIIASITARVAATVIDRQCTTGKHQWARKQLCFPAGSVGRRCQLRRNPTLRRTNSVFRSACFSLGRQPLGIRCAHNSLITAGNGGTKPIQAAFTIYYNHGTQQYQLEQSLQPDEQMWVDVGKLIREEVSDKPNENPLNRALSFLAYQQFSAEKFRARIAWERRSPTRSTHSTPTFVPPHDFFHARREMRMDPVLILVFPGGRNSGPLTCKCETWFPTTNGGRGSPYRIKSQLGCSSSGVALALHNDPARRRPLAVSFASSEKVTTQIFRFEATTKASKAVSTDVFFNSRLTLESPVAPMLIAA